MNKGERTRLAILRQSIIYSSQFGLADITIGTVSKLCNLSRTGVISHFENKEDMQIAILAYGESLFREKVVTCSYDQNPLTHLTNLLQHWSNWTADMFKEHQVGCPFIKAIIEFQNRPPSNVRTFSINQQDRLLNYLSHRIMRCIEAKLIDSHYQPQTIAYELYSLYLGRVLTQHSQVIEDAEQQFEFSVKRLIAHYKSAQS